MTQATDREEPLSDEAYLLDMVASTEAHFHAFPAMTEHLKRLRDIAARVASQAKAGAPHQGELHAKETSRQAPSTVGAMVSAGNRHDIACGTSGQALQRTFSAAPLAGRPEPDRSLRQDACQVVPAAGALQPAREAEPVAWRYRYTKHVGSVWQLANEPPMQWAADVVEFEEEPLYSHPPAHPTELRSKIPDAPSGGSGKGGA